MSLMAGIYSLDPTMAPEPESIATVKRTLSHGDDPIEVFEDSRFFLAKLDLGLFRDPAFLTGRYVATVTGEPFLNPRPGTRSLRGQDLQEMADRLGAGDLFVLKECQGSYSFCFYDPGTGALLVSTDRVGVRPVYFFIGPRFVFFSSNLRVLEGLAAVPKRMDLRAVTEEAALGFPLADRTPFADVKVLRGGQALRCADGRAAVETYWSWRDLRETSLSREEMLDRAYETWLSAVECRAARDKEALCFVSGGLDSRVVASGLHSVGKKIHGLTFEYPGVMDGPLAREFAGRLGIRHTTVVVPRGVARQRLLKATAAERLQHDAKDESRFPRLFFSGDGGSVGLGYVYLTPEITELMRAGRIDDAIAKYLGGNALPSRIFRPDIWKRVDNVVFRGIREELERAASHDGGRDFHIFLMENDQRRHIYYLFEDLDEYRIEFLLPFWDARFLELIASGPVDWYLQHAFYYDWLRKFPEAAYEIPWQAYPGHRPCPLEIKSEYRAQWKRTRGERFSDSKLLFVKCLKGIFSPRFPTRILSRPRMLLAIVLHGMRIRDYTYICKTCATYLQYFPRCGGQLVFPD